MSIGGRGQVENCLTKEIKREKYLWKKITRYTLLFVSAVLSHITCHIIKFSYSISKGTLMMKAIRYTNSFRNYKVVIEICQFSKVYQTQLKLIANWFKCSASEIFWLARIDVIIISLKSSSSWNSFMTLYAEKERGLIIQETTIHSGLTP